MGTLECSVSIKATPGDVWKTYVDPSRLPEWQTGSPVTPEVHGKGDQPGSTYSSGRGPGTARTTVLAAVPPRRIVTRTVARKELANLKALFEREVQEPPDQPVP
jgi:uncharacterized protein YndB with AHSA1/START domain